MRVLRSVVSLILVLASLFLCVRITSDSTRNKQDKVDLAELNDIKYGLLSVDAWKARLGEILTAEIEKIDLASIDQAELREHIETLLNTMIDKVAKNIKKENSGSLSGWVKQSFIDAFVSLEDVKKGIPEYTSAILKEMSSRKTTGQLKTALRGQLEKYSTEIKGTIDTSRRQEIVRATEAKNPAEAKAKLEDSVAETTRRIAKNAWLMIGSSILLFVLVGFSAKPLSPSNYAFLVVTLVALLSAGVMTPMIDLEAKISRMEFVLLGNPLQFENQVLYFQSKSILDVFLVMMRDSTLQMQAVGVLMVTFSIIFPALKLLSSAVYHFDLRHAKDNPVIKFFVLKSGKWAMADVTVVAIFMAFIGFNGIIDSKLGQLNSAEGGPVLLTTNGTSLQPGYYLFFVFAVLAQVLGEFLTKRGPAADGVRSDH